MGPNLPLHLPCITGSRTFFLGFLPLALFRLRNIKSCFVITPPNSPFSHLFRTPTPALFSPVSCTPRVPYSPRLPLCPPTLLFFFSLCSMTALREIVQEEHGEPRDPSLMNS